MRLAVPETLSSNQIREVIQQTRNKKLQREYTEKLCTEGEEKISQYIFCDYQRKPSWFTRNGQEFLRHKFEPWSFRWKDSEDVMDRLNAPEVIRFYVQTRLRYANYWNIPGYSSTKYSNMVLAEYVFKHKKGDCLYTSGFISEALSRNGYNAWRDH